MERKFTDDEIVKALEYCNKPAGKNDCELCPFYHSKGRCTENMLSNAIDLINRQKAEIDRLADRNHKCIYLSDDETTEFCVDGPCPKFKTEAQIRAEAIKEFAERLKVKVGSIPQYHFNLLQVEDDIDTLVKEMTEEGTE